MSRNTKGPSVLMKTIIVLGLALAVGVAMVAKSKSKVDSRVEIPEPSVQASSVEQKAKVSGEEASTQNSPTESSSKALPKLIDLGAGKCIPCKMMEPILEDLKKEYRGRFDVVFIDVWENRTAGDEYRIRVIPTQIFFDAQGKELFRHEGFYSKKDILGKWGELGFTFDKQG